VPPRLMRKAHRVRLLCRCRLRDFAPFFSLPFVSPTCCQGAMIYPAVKAACSWSEAAVPIVRWSSTNFALTYSASLRTLLEYSNIFLGGQPSWANTIL